MSKDVKTIKRFEHYTTQEIIEKFKKLHEYAMGCLEEVEEFGEVLKLADEQQEGAWTMIMELLGKDVWYIYNDYLD